MHGYDEGHFILIQLLLWKILCPAESYREPLLINVNGKSNRNIKRNNELKYIQPACYEIVAYCVSVWFWLHFQRSMNNQSVLARIKAPIRMDSDICLISFEADHTVAYTTLLRSGLGNTVALVRPHIIRQHADICGLPHCKWYIMFAEYSAR